jgi:hypothetical protein
MKDIDRKITEALRQSYPEVDLAPEPNIAEELITAFRGRNQWTNLYALVVSLLAFGVAIWAGWRFYHAPELRDMLLWGGLSLLGVLMLSFIKIWFWLEMQSNRVLREIKRIELFLIDRAR